MIGIEIGVPSAVVSGSMRPTSTSARGRMKTLGTPRGSRRGSARPRPRRRSSRSGRRKATLGDRLEVGDAGAGRVGGRRRGRLARGTGAGGAVPSGVRTGMFPRTARHALLLRRRLRRLRACFFILDATVSTLTPSSLPITSHSIPARRISTTSVGVTLVLLAREIRRPSRPHRTRAPTSAAVRGACPVGRGTVWRGGSRRPPPPPAWRPRC